MKKTAVDDLMEHLDNAERERLRNETIWSKCKEHCITIAMNLLIPVAWISFHVVGFALIDAYKYYING